MQQTWVNPQQWVQPSVGDISYIAGWKKARGGVPFGAPSLDLHELAFNPVKATRLPDEGPSDELEEPGWTAAFLRTPAPAPWDAQAAELYLSYYNLHAQFWPVFQEKWAAPRILAGRMSFWVAPAGMGTSCLPSLIAAHFTLRAPEQSLLRFLDPSLPPGPLVLAVRSARRAVAAEPESPEAYVMLAKAYLNLWKGQEERWRGRFANMPLTFQNMESQFRQTQRLIQVVTALHNALTLKPSLVEAHLMLKDIYLQIHYWDTALHHWQEALKYLQENPPNQLPSEGAEEFQQRQDRFTRTVKDLKKQIRGLKQEVARRTKDFRLQSADKRLQDKVLIAIQIEYNAEGGRGRDRFGRGLASRALDLLLKAKGRELDATTIMWQIRLLLTMGRVRDVRERLDDVQNHLVRLKKELKGKTKPNPRMQQAVQLLRLALPWYKSLLESATGNYKEADAQRAKIHDLIKASGLYRVHLAVQALQGLAFNFMLNNQPLIQPAVFQMFGAQANQGAFQVGQSLKSEAEMHLVSGLSALEQGEIDRAAGYFRKCVRVSRDLRFGDNAFPDRVIAIKYLEEIDREKEKSEK
jgi:tetratricopeptide (TPR) repeat protein